MGYSRNHAPRIEPRPRAAKPPHALRQPLGRLPITPRLGLRLPRRPDAAWRNPFDRVGVIALAAVRGRLLAFLAVLGVLLLASPREASAFPWMIRQGVTSCQQCHGDPSGGGVLTAYGREQGDLTLRMRYGNKSDIASDSAGFLFGLVSPPDWLLAGGSFRGGALHVAPQGIPADTRVVQMQSDLRGMVVAESGFRAGVSAGFMVKGAQPAWVTSNPQANLVSREHWVGYAFADRDGLVRAGRIVLPFGIRDTNHRLWVRDRTRTDINDSQQHGVALAYRTTNLRGEIMGVAGNFQTSPDAYRERGYSGFAELAVAKAAAVGVSSLTTFVQRDPRTRQKGGRMAHGLFARYSPWKPLVILAEGDVLVALPDKGSSRIGHASMLTADVEILQGLHVQATGETTAPGGSSPAAPNSQLSYGGWGTVLWFFAPHTDLRLDLVEQSVPAGPTRLNVFSALVQLHLYL